MDVKTQTNFWDSRIVPAATLTGYFIVCSLLLQPYDDLPFVDDWTYAWSVEQLLKTGELRISDWSAHYPLAQILVKGRSPIHACGSGRQLDTAAIGERRLRQVR